MKTETLQKKLEKKAKKELNEIQNNSRNLIDNDPILSKLVFLVEIDGQKTKRSLSNIVYYGNDIIMKEVLSDLLAVQIDNVTTDFMQSVEEAKNAIEDLNNY